MRVSDILRAMISMVDAAEQESGSVSQHPTGVAVDNAGPNNTAAQPAHKLNIVAVDNTPEDEKTTMVPPLQQKIELMKRAVAVDNEFDNGFDQIDQAEGKSQPDELDHIKKMAGLHPVIQQELTNDDPLEQ